MALHCNIDGKKKITKLFANVNGETRKIKSLWVNDNGVPRKIFSFKYGSVGTLLFTTQTSNLSGEQALVEGMHYDFWLIGSGGNGGRGGDGWGLYDGGGGGAGGTGAYVHVSFIALANMRVSWQTTGTTNIDVSVWIGSVRVLHFGMDSSNTNGGNGEDAGAFKPRPGGGSSGAAGTYYLNNSDVTAVPEFVYDIEYSNGTSVGQNAGNSNGQSAPTPVDTPYTIPPQLAQAGENAYYSTNPDDLCLGNAGGGGDWEENGGTGAPGGLILVAS